MPRKAPRAKLAPGIYTDGGTSVEIELMVNGHRYSERHHASTPLPYLIERRALLRQDASKVAPLTPKGTVAGDAPLYLRLIRHLHPTTQRSHKAHLDAWGVVLKGIHRHKVTAHHILRARATWLEDDDSPKTINHRVHTLRRLYKILDGKRAPTPCDDVSPLPVHRTPIQRVTPETILAVHQALWAAISRPIKHPSKLTAARRAEARKTHARFCVLASTGRRPSEVGRAKPTDVNLKARVWVPRDGKGGWSPGIYLNDDMLAAWQLFIAADAWGEINTSAYAKRLRRAGWPVDVPPYNARHSLLIAMAEAGVDMADLQVHSGHKQLATTRRHYTGIINSRVQRTSESVDKRLGGFAVNDSGTGHFGTDE
jgi:integrase